MGCGKSEFQKVFEVQIEKTSNDEKNCSDEIKKSGLINVGDVIKECLFKDLLCLNFFLDVLKKQFGKTMVFLVERKSTKELFVMKMINIGQEGSDERKKSQKEIAAEIKIGMTLGQECPFLVRYFETFYHQNFCCLIMEYCELGDLQQELNSGKQYDEPVYYFYLFYFFVFYFYFFLGVKEMVSSCLPWSFETSLS
jgi:hypothetical protein